MRCFRRAEVTLRRRRPPNRRRSLKHLLSASARHTPQNRRNTSAAAVGGGVAGPGAVAALAGRGERFRADRAGNRRSPEWTRSDTNGSSARATSSPSATNTLESTNASPSGFDAHGGLGHVRRGSPRGLAGGPIRRDPCNRVRLSGASRRRSVVSRVRARRPVDRSGSPSAFVNERPDRRRRPAVVAQFTNGDRRHGSGVSRVRDGRGRCDQVGATTPLGSCCFMKPNM